MLKRVFVALATILSISGCSRTKPISVTTETSAVTPQREALIQGKIPLLTEKSAGQLMPLAGSIVWAGSTAPGILPYIGATPYRPSLVVEWGHPAGIFFFAKYAETRENLTINIPDGCDDRGTFGGLSASCYVQLGLADLDQTGNPEVIIAVGDGASNLGINVWRYRPPAQAKEMAQDTTWELVGSFSGETQAVISSHRLTLLAAADGKPLMFTFNGGSFSDARGHSLPASPCIGAYSSTAVRWTTSTVQWSTRDNCWIARSGAAVTSLAQSRAQYTPAADQTTAHIPWTPTDDFLPSDGDVTWSYVGPGDGFGTTVWLDQAHLPRNSAGMVRVLLLLKWSKQVPLTSEGKQVGIVDEEALLADINCPREEWRWLRQSWLRQSSERGLEKLVYQKPFDRNAVDKMEWSPMRSTYGPNMSDRVLRTVCYRKTPDSAFSLMPKEQREAALQGDAAAAYGEGLQRALSFKCEHLEQLRQSGAITEEQAQIEKQNLCCQ